MAAPLLPEFLAVLGIDVFLILSILSCLFEFPVFVQYVYHISAYIGFLQLWIDYVFAFAEETRFLICVAYLLIGLANVIFLNGYVGCRDKKILWITSILCCVTIPSILVSVSAVSFYVNRVAISLPSFPLISSEVIAAILLICGIVLATSIVLSAFIPQLQGSPISHRRKKEVKDK